MSQQSVKYPQALEEAFHTFNRLSGQLADSYQALELRVANLNEELNHAHDERFKELTEKERLANRLSSLLDALPGGVVVLDQQGVVAEYNPVAAELLGEPLQGLAWQLVIKRVFAPRGDDGHDVSLNDGRRVNISTCPLGSEPGQILLITDVTEVRKLQDRLSQHQRLAAMGEMAASLAHQIRTPLSSAILYSSRLKHQHVSDQERQHCGEKIISRLRHLEHVVNDMLLYARGARPGTERFSVEELFTDVLLSVENQLDACSVDMSVLDETKNSGLTGNRQMLVSALINLIVNAIQSVEGGGLISMAATRLSDKVLQIRIRDNGRGFSPEEKLKAFEPFFTTRKEGTGLGLAVVDTIISAHDGDISLESTKGQGSCFTIQLPLLEMNRKNPAHDVRKALEDEQIVSMR